MHEPPKRRKLTKTERKKVYAICGGRCAYCGAQITLDDMQVDHVIPMSFSECYQVQGFDLDTMDNYLPACRICNHYKSTLTIEKFRYSIERLPYALERDSSAFRRALRFGLVWNIGRKVQFYFEERGVKVPSLEWRKNDESNT